VQQLALRAGLAFQAAPGGGGVGGALQLAGVLSEHGGALNWAAGLVQVGGGEAVGMLRAVAAVRAPPAALTWLLAQCQLAAVPEAELPAAAAALLQLAPTHRQEEPGAAQLCVAVQRVLLSLAGRGRAAADAAGEASLQLLLAACKGVKPKELGPALGARGELRLASVDLAALAAWVFQPPPKACSAAAVRALMGAAGWRWAAAGAAPALRVRWLMAGVAAGKALLAGGDEGAGTLELADALAGAAGWALCQPGAEGEAYMLCLLDAPTSENELVQALWLHVQAAAALAQCAAWAAGGGADAAARIADLKAGAQLMEKLQSMCQRGRAGAAVDYVGRVVEQAAGAAGFRLLLPTLAAVVGAALAAAGSPGQGAAAASAAAGRAVAACAAAAVPATHAAEATAELALLDLDAQEASPSAAAAPPPPPPAPYLDPPYAAVVAWLGLLVQQLVRAEEGVSSVCPDDLLERVVQASYYLLPGADSRAHAATAAGRSGLLAAALLSATEAATPAQLRDLRASLLAARKPWLGLLSAWVGDAAALADALPALGDAAAPSAGAGPTVGQLSAALEVMQAPAADAALSAAEVDEVLSLLELLKSAGVSFAALPLWHEFFLRVRRRPAAAAAAAGGEGPWGGLLPAQEVIRQLGTTGQALGDRSKRLGEVAYSLMAFVSVAAPKKGQSLPPTLPFVGTPELAAQLAQHDGRWRRWAADAAAAPRDAAHGDAAAGAPAAAPPVDPSAVEYVLHRQQAQAEGLQEAAGMLRLWARRGEKQAAVPAGEAPAPGAGREGDVPAPLAAAQHALWEGSQGLTQEVGTLHTDLRQRVCRRYQRVDPAALQAVSEACDDGQRIPAPVDPRHAEQCKELRRRARAAVRGVGEAKEFLAAAPDLFRTEYLLLEDHGGGGGGGGGGEDRGADAARVKSQLLLSLAQVLVDGSTPPVAAPFLSSLFQRALASGAAALDAGAKAQLVPRIARAMGAGGGGRSPLREREAVLLLRASLDPDALLEAGRLREFLSALRLVLRLCRDVPGPHAASMLGSFDAQRFALLVAERAPPPGGGGAGGAGGSSSSSSAGAAVSPPGAFAVSTCPATRASPRPAAPPCAPARLDACTLQTHPPPRSCVLHSPTSPPPAPPPSVHAAVPPRGRRGAPRLGRRLPGPAGGPALGRRRPGGRPRAGALGLLRRLPGGRAGGARLPLQRHHAGHAGPHPHRPPARAGAGGGAGPARRGAGRRLPAAADPL
jgi:hypothetical protein